MRKTQESQSEICLCPDCLKENRELVTKEIERIFEDLPGVITSKNMRGLDILEWIIRNVMETESFEAMIEPMLRTEKGLVHVSREDAFEVISFLLGTADKVNDEQKKAKKGIGLN